jgi:hypothetical protein
MANNVEFQGSPEKIIARCTHNQAPMKNRHE